MLHYQRCLISVWRPGAGATKQLLVSQCLEAQFSIVTIEAYGLIRVWGPDSTWSSIIYNTVTDLLHSAPYVRFVYFLTLLQVKSKCVDPKNWPPFCFIKLIFCRFILDDTVWLENVWEGIKCGGFFWLLQRIDENKTGRSPFACIDHWRRKNLKMWNYSSGNISWNFCKKKHA